MNKRKKSLLFILFIFNSACGLDPHFSSMIENRELIKKYLGKEPAEWDLKKAKENVIQSLNHEPFLGEHHYNLGLILDNYKEPEEAQKSYLQSLQYLPTSQKYYAYFNLGELLGRAKKTDSALENYQEALNVTPESLEVKTNIELLVKEQENQSQNQQNQNNQDQNQKDQNKDNNNKDNKDGKDNKNNKDKDDNKENNKNNDKNNQDQKDKKNTGQRAESPKYKPREFKGKELSEADVKKILGELKQQEQKIRREFNRKQEKENPREKDW